MLRQQGKLSEALTIAQQATALSEELHKNCPPVQKEWCAVFLWRSYLFSGTLSLDLGNFAAAEPLLQQALALAQRDISQENDRAIASFTTLLPLGNLAFLRGDYQQADRWFEQALALSAPLNNPQNYESYRFLSLLFNSMALLRQEQLNFSEAEALLQKSRQFLEAASPSPQRDDDLLTALGNLGNLAYARGDYQQAEPLLQRSPPRPHQRPPERDR